MTISNSTISENTASGVGRDGAENHSQGGGIYNNGTLWVNNSTLSENEVLAGTGGSVGTTGGGISNSFSGILTISNTTFRFNGASSRGAISNKGATALQNTIVVNSFVLNSNGGNCAGSIVSNGYNLSSDGTCNFNAHGDLNNHDPMLGPLKGNGGPTQTMALLPGSPAIDAGNPSGCTDGQGHLLKTDQRGAPRPDREDKVGCDIGAFERQSD